MRSVGTCLRFWLLAIGLAVPFTLIQAETNAEATNSEAAPSSQPVSPDTRTPIASSGKVDFDSFKIVSDRNIFNGNRSGQRVTSTRSSSQQRSVRVDAFALVGTLLSERGASAFFDGTESGFRKALKAGEHIGDFEIQEVHYSGVRLLDGTNTLDMQVGHGLRREDNGLWKPTSGGTSFAAAPGSQSSGSYNGYASSSSSSPDRNSSSRTESQPGSSSTSSTPDINADEILRRLMEKREKE